MKKVSIILVVLGVFGCNSSIDYEKRIIIKRINVNKDLKVEWYHYSLITGFSPDFVEFKMQNGKRHLICKSVLICDVQLKKDSIMILTEKNDFIELNTKPLFNLKVSVDTTCKGKYLYKE